MTCLPKTNVWNNAVPASTVEAAVRWEEWGLKPVPMPSFEEIRFNWARYLADPTAAAFRAAWHVEPYRQLGALLDDTVLVLVARTAEARSTLSTIERALGKEPNQKHDGWCGEYHFFRRKPGTRAVMESHSPYAHSHRIDIRTGRSATEGRSLVPLPPSEGQKVILGEASSVSDLVEADQVLIDFVSLNNGSPKPRAKLIRPIRTLCFHDHHGVQIMLSRLDPNLVLGSVPDVLRGIHKLTGGDAKGLRIAQWWTSRLRAAYPGDEAIEYAWRSCE